MPLLLLAKTGRFCSTLVTYHQRSGRPGWSGVHSGCLNFNARSVFASTMHSVCGKRSILWRCINLNILRLVRWDGARFSTYRVRAPTKEKVKKLFALPKQNSMMIYLKFLENITDYNKIGLHVRFIIFFTSDTRQCLVSTMYGARNKCTCSN